MSPGTAWLAENAAFQLLNGTIWMSVMGTLLLIGAGIGGATTMALGIAVGRPGRTACRKLVRGPGGSCRRAIRTPGGSDDP